MDVTRFNFNKEAALHEPIGAAYAFYVMGGTIGSLVMSLAQNIAIWLRDHSEETGILFEHREKLVRHLQKTSIEDLLRLNADARLLSDSELTALLRRAWPVFNRWAVRSFLMVHPMIQEKGILTYVGFRSSGTEITLTSIRQIVPQTFLVLLKKKISDFSENVTHYYYASHHEGVQMLLNDRFSGCPNVQIGLDCWTDVGENEVIITRNYLTRLPLTGHTMPAYLDKPLQVKDARKTPSCVTYSLFGPFVPANEFRLNGGVKLNWGLKIDELMISIPLFQCLLYLYLEPVVDQAVVLETERPSPINRPTFNIRPERVEVVRKAMTLIEDNLPWMSIRPHIFSGSVEDHCQQVRSIVFSI